MASATVPANTSPSQPAARIGAAACGLAEAFAGHPAPRLRDRLVLALRQLAAALAGEARS